MSVKNNDLSIRAAPEGRHQIFSGRHGPTEGMYLVVNADGSRRFLWRYVSPRTGRPSEAGLGSYPKMTFAVAKQQVIEWRNMVRNNIDPVAERRAAKAAVRVEGKTLADVLADYGKQHEGEAGAEEGVRLIRRHCATLLVKPANADLKPVEIKEVLKPVIALTPKTAARTR